MGGRDGYARIMGSKAWKEPLEHGYLHVPFQYHRGPIGWNVVRLGERRGFGRVFDGYGIRKRAHAVEQLKSVVGVHRRSPEHTLWIDVNSVAPLAVAVRLSVQYEGVTLPPPSRQLPIARIRIVV